MDNSYGGDTTILAGQLRIDGNATLGDGTGTVHLSGGTLQVSGASATLGAGDVTVTGGLLQIESGVADAIANTALLSISGTGLVDLGSGIDEMISALSLGGVQQASGAYGSSASSAMFKLDQYFSGMGIVTVSPAATLAADFDVDGDVDADDLADWKGGFGTGMTQAEGDADGDADVDGADFLVWQRQLGTTPATASVAAVPEPDPAALALVAAAAALGRGFRSRGRRQLKNL